MEYDMYRFLVFLLLASCAAPGGRPVEVFHRPYPPCVAALLCFETALDDEDRIECRAMPDGELAGEAHYRAALFGDTELMDECYGVSVVML